MKISKAFVLASCIQATGYIAYYFMVQAQAWNIKYYLVSVYVSSVIIFFFLQSKSFRVKTGVKICLILAGEAVLLKELSTAIGFTGLAKGFAAFEIEGLIRDILLFGMILFAYAFLFLLAYFLNKLIVNKS